MPTVIRATIVATVVVIQLAGAAHAFDHQRKGLVLGLGIGLCPVAKWSHASADPEDDWRGEYTGGALLAIAGYSFGEKNTVALEINTSASKTDKDESRDATFIGPVWYHYRGQAGKSIFYLLGLGGLLLSYDDLDCGDSDECDKANAGGLALQLGVGYEFRKHWQARASLTVGTAEEIHWIGWGATEHGFDVSYFSMLISFFAY